MFEEQFASNSFLNISNSPTFPKFLHQCCDELIEGTPVSLENYNNDVEWSTDDVIETRNLIQELFCNCAINETFHVEGDIPETVKNSLKECYETRKAEIQQHLIKASFLRSGHNLVENIDWKLKWILGSSKLASIREPVLQLTLGCVKKGLEDLKPKENIVNFELNLEQVDYLISVLENIKAELN